MLKELLNIEAILNNPRKNQGYSVMDNFFIGGKVIASSSEEDESNRTSYVYQFEDDTVAIVSEHFANITLSENEDTDKELKEKCELLADNAKTFSTIKDAFLFLRKAKQDNATYFELKDVIDPLIKNLYKNKAINLSQILGAK